MLYALLVGIDRYPVRPLRGCRNDAEQAAEFLRERAGERLNIRLLLDEDATREGLIAAFREQFGGCRPGDVALFWYAGHGSVQAVAEELWWLEPSGTAQSLVCVDSRRNGMPDLLDRELGLLVGEVEARGARCVVVLDCCHAESGTRDAGSTVRALPAAREPASAAALLAGLGEPGDGSGHLLFAACRTFETAKELRLDGRTRGAFTHAMIHALREANARTTARDVHTAARCLVEDLCHDQTPVLHPYGPGSLADEPVLGGAVSPPTGPFTLRRLHGRWQVDAGYCQGVAAGAVLAVRSGPEQGARVTIGAASAGRSAVEPDGWEPDPDRTYPMAVVSLPIVPVKVAIVGDGPEAAALEQAVRRLGSPFLAADPDGPWTVDFPEPAVAEVALPDGAVVLRETGSGFAGLPLRLEHLAVWTHVRELRNPWSELDGLIDLEVVAARPGETRAPADRAPLVADASGEIRLAYRHDGTAWIPPEVFVRIRNRFGRRLWCVLLDLTDRYRLHAGLFPGAFVGAGRVAAAAHGRPIPVSLPRGRPIRPGASAVDWCELLVSEEEVASLAFALPSLDEGRSRAAPLLAALASWRRRRDMGVGGGPGDWTTVLVPVRTVVPDLTDPE